MQFTIRYIIFYLSMLLAINLPAQNLTGTWEGDIGNDQFLQLNILQTGNKICGYTRDHVKKDTTSFCKAFFEGSFDKWGKTLTIDGKYFLETTKGHFLMNLQLEYKIKDGVEILEHLLPKTEDPFSDMVDTLFSKIFSLFSKPKNNPFLEIDSSDYVHLRKVSDKPYEIIELMKDCIGRDRSKKDTAIKKISPKPADSLPPVVQAPVPAKPKDSIAPAVVVAPAEIKKDSVAKPKTIVERKNIEQSHLQVDVKTINLKVYDNAIMDGDTVSILYNGKMLLTHQLLSEKGIELNIELDTNAARHEITLFAENLGSIPPNTALIVVTAGKKRYELFASASLDENAVLVFDYKPQ
jgi:hypothetical protein